MAHDLKGWFDSKTAIIYIYINVKIKSLRACNSMVEYVAHNNRVVGSIPTRLISSKYNIKINYIENI